MKKKTIYYWSPFLTEIATTKAVINSAYSLNKYSKKYEAYIINAAGEFDEKKNELKRKKINFFSLNKISYTKFLPKYGKIFSRISFIIIFLFSFFSLKKVLKQRKPEYIIIHLITSLPIILFSLFKFKTKCILRISGFPKLNIFRFYLWRFFLKNICYVTCPTKGTYEYIKKLDIIDRNKIFYLPDPIIHISEIISQKNEKIFNNNFNYLIAVGRLTKQKNFNFLINVFNEIIQFDRNKNLLIFGNGEEKNNLNKLISKLGLNNKIKILSHTKNIFPYIKKADCFVLSSLWEDPGFVLVESAFCKTFIISSDCKNGPKEIIGRNNAGILYKTSDIDDFITKYKKFLTMDEKKKKLIKINALIASKNFTIYNHYKTLYRIIK